MDKFEKITSSAVPMPLEHVDTDQIIPARFLKATTREGFGDNLFRDWRYDRNDEPIKDFVLNNPGFSGDILIAGKNFGCGSSREHAAWALYDFGFRVVVSSFFADIFKGNALNNGILPIQLNEEEVQQFFSLIENDPSTKFKVDLNEQKISDESGQFTYSFEIDPYKKMCLLQGYNDLDFLLSLNEEIETFEKNQKIY